MFIWWGINFDYIIFMLPVYILTLVASGMVKSTFHKYSEVETFSGMSGAEAARKVLDANGLYDVQIEPVRGRLTDHYDPRTNVVRLSEAVYSERSVAAVGVACHEVGHAIQHAQGYVPLKIRNAIIPITSIGSQLSMPLIMVGIILATFSEHLIVVANIGIVMFGFCVLFQLVTLPVEFNASHRSIKSLEEHNILEKSELKGARKVLTAAGMTYVAALATSVAQLIYLLRIVGFANRDDN